jgi:predicted permease
MALLQDLRHALRRFFRTPGLTIVAVASIAITIGATAVVFTAIRTVLLDPLPYADAGRLVQFRSTFARFPDSHADWVSWLDMQDVIRRNRTFQSIGTYNYALFNLAGDGNEPPEQLYGLVVSADMFPTLGVKPMLGRNILPEETQPGRDHEIILSFGLWVRRFNSDPRVVGRSVDFNGHACTIIGVMPPGFDFPMRLATTVQTPSRHMDFWAPLAVDPSKATRNGTGFGAVGRLRNDVSQTQAEQDVLDISAALAREFPRTNEGRSLRLGSLRDRTFGFARTGLLLLLGAALLFLLIGCANVANLLLALASARSGEIAVRLALGAGRGRIVRQFLTESSLLSIAGGLCGYVLTVVAWKLLPAFAPMSIPRLEAARADWTIFAFTFAISIVTGLIFGTAPALIASRQDPPTGWRESGSRRSIGGVRNRLRSALVVGEVAIAVTLVVIGGLLTGSFVKLLRTDPGFDAPHLLASIIVGSGDRYKTPASREPLFRAIVQAVRALPGVQSAGTVDALPFSGENTAGVIGAGDGAEPLRQGELEAEIDRVNPGYLPTMGVRLLQGRWLAEDDLEISRDSALVNDVAANRLWPGEDPLGKRLCLFCDNEKARKWKRVVGVVSSIRHGGLEEPASAEVYSAAGAYQSAQFLVVRTERPPAEMSQAIRRAVASVDPKQPVFLSASMSTLIGDSIADRRFIMTLLAITGCLALFLAAAGVYGVISYSTSLRTLEIGVRMALGASPPNVWALVFRQGMLLAGIGIAFGLASALALTKILRSLRIGLASTDPLLVAIAVALVTATAVIACWIPARRATRIDPVVALRQP